MLILGGSAPRLLSANGIVGSERNFGAGGQDLPIGSIEKSTVMAQPALAAIDAMQVQI
jgi:hypothetical protein